MYVVAVSEGVQKVTEKACWQDSMEDVLMQKQKDDRSHLAKLCKEKAKIQTYASFICISAVLFACLNIIFTGKP